MPPYNENYHETLDETYIKIYNINILNIYINFPLGKNKPRKKESEKKVK